jgi:hypothetical protein
LERERKHDSRTDGHNHVRAVGGETRVLGRDLVNANGQAEENETPRSSVAAVRVTEVITCRAESDARTRTAPDWSETVPSIEPSVVCAAAGVDKTSATARARHKSAAEVPQRVGAGGTPPPGMPEDSRFRPAEPNESVSNVSGNLCGVNKLRDDDEVRRKLPHREAERG